MTMKNLVVGGLAVGACCLAAGAADDSAQVIYRSFNFDFETPDTRLFEIPGKDEWEALRKTGTKIANVNFVPVSY